jgi:para-nitrobenzyl esterase
MAIATTRQGRVEGETYRGTVVFRGIRYARPPEGGLRFRAPEPPDHWRGVLPARKFGAAAPQVSPVLPALERLIGGSASGRSEDCLSLNVWTPALDGKRRPVMVWIHGGAFVMGSGSAGIYSGRRLARRGDLVVVTLNYRLGALGFLDLRDLGGVANLGIRDQIAALEWVRDNIAAFGGDPENVTIFGESAGAMSTGTLLGTPRANGLFHRAILQSGAADNVFATGESKQVTESFLRRATSSGPLDLAKLQVLPLPELLRAQNLVSMQLRMRLGGLAWQPCVDGDLIPTPPIDAIAKGLSSAVPVLVGTNSEEWKLFMLADRLRAISRDELVRRLRRALPGFDAEGRPWSDRALVAYEQSDSTPSEIWVAFQSDRIFRVPALRLAERQASHTAATFTYEFTWSPPFTGGLIGACHGLEIPFVFGTLRKRSLRPFLGLSRGALRLSSRMQQAWIDMARSGDPSHDELPHWPRYDAAKRATMMLGSRCSVVHAPGESERLFWEHATS